MLLAREVWENDREADFQHKNATRERTFGCRSMHSVLRGRRASTNAITIMRLPMVAMRITAGEEEARASSELASCCNASGTFKADEERFWLVRVRRAYASVLPFAEHLVYALPPEPLVSANANGNGCEEREREREEGRRDARADGSLWFSRLNLQTSISVSGPASLFESRRAYYTSPDTRTSWRYCLYESDTFCPLPIHHRGGDPRRVLARVLGAAAHNKSGASATGAGGKPQQDGQGKKPKDVVGVIDLDELAAKWLASRADTHTDGVVDGESKGGGESREEDEKTPTRARASSASSARWCCCMRCGAMQGG
ncbi:hypothetical protein B0H19DRAFT_1275072 [Mycena capillaripes]|nr:hypothetical protein B0H19DRAFT_1275072 [Mycena capillaripes]